MSIYGTALYFASNDTTVSAIPSAVLSGFTFNIRGTNYGTTLFVSPNNAVFFIAGSYGVTHTLTTTNVAIGYNTLDNKTYRTNYFRTTTASYDIVTIQYFFETIYNGTSGNTNSGRGSVGQMNIRLIKNLSDQRQFIELSSNNSSAITNIGQWAFADGVSLTSIPAIFPSSGQRSIVLVSDASGSSWQIGNQNAYLPFELTTLYTELVNGVGVVTKDASGNMTDVVGSTVLTSRNASGTSYTSNPTSFTFNINGTNHGGTIVTNTYLVMGLGTSNGVLGTTTSLATTMRGFSFGGNTVAVNRISWIDKTTVSSGGFSYNIVTYLYWFENTTSGVTGQTNYLLSSGQQRVRFIKRSDGIQFVEVCNVKGSSAAIGTIGTWQMSIFDGSAVVNNINNLGINAATMRSINMAITHVSNSTGTSWIPMYNTYVNV
jgi:hypothetical protein